MSKTTQGATLPKIETTETKPNMLQTQTVATTTAKVVLENPNGTSYRLVYYNHDGWDKTRDLSLTDLTQASAGLEAIGKMVAGGYTGGPNLFLVAPEEKVLYQFGTGTMAYVSNQYQKGRDDVVVEIDGMKVILSVDPQDVPTELGYQRLHLVSGTLYAKDYEKQKPLTPRASDPWSFWNCFAVSAMLTGVNVSVSVGPRTMQRARDILDVFNADDKVTAYATHLWAGRESSRVSRDAGTNLAELNALSQETGQPIQVNASDLDVPLRGGGVISLGRFNKTTPIHIATAAGLNLSDRWLKDDTDAARLAMANSLRQHNLVIVLR